MFWSKLCKSSWNCAWSLAFPLFISPIVWNMCENLHYESVYFKELHNRQEYYWPTIYRTEAAVVSTITSCKHCSESAWWRRDVGDVGEIREIRERRVENYRHQWQKIMAIAISWWRCLCFFTGTEERDEPTNNYTVIPCISEYNAMHKYFIPFILLHDFLSHIKRYIVYILLSEILLRFPLVFEVKKNVRNNEGNA